MTKGTPSMGRKSGKVSHIACRRCGLKAYHLRHKRCASCGFGASAKRRVFNWNKKKVER